MDNVGQQDRDRRWRQEHPEEVRAKANAEKVAYMRGWRERNPEKTKEQYQARQKAQSREREQWFFETVLKDASCEHCGETDHRVFDMHHVDPSVKEFNISARVRWANKERILAEVDKCIILCANCHRRHHYDERQLTKM